MAAIPQQKPRLRNDEVEFQAEDELVTIVPKFESDVFALIGGRYGPFVPQTPVQVPLWLAVELRKQQKCQIQCPAWMTAEGLKNAKRLEKEAMILELKPLPSHYMEIAALILRHAAEDIENVNMVRSLLEDLENIRQHKIRQGLQQMADHHATEPLEYLKMNNACYMELNSIRGILLTSLEHFYKMYDDGFSAMKSADFVVSKVEAMEEAGLSDGDDDGQGDGRGDTNNVTYLGNARIRRAQADRGASQSQSQSQSQDDDGLAPLHSSSMPVSQATYESDLDEDDIMAAMQQ